MTFLFSNVPGVCAISVALLASFVVRDIILWYLLTQFQHTKLASFQGLSFGEK